MYRQQRNKVVDLVKVAKKNYFHQKIEHCKGNSAKLWHQMKKLSGKNVNQDFSTFIVKDGKTVSDPESISNYLNDYFVNIATSLVDGIKDGAYNPSDPLLAFINSKLPAGTNFSIPSVTVSYVKKSLKEMDHKKARDQINTNLIHKTAEVVAEPLCKLINCSIETGMFPDLWKHARVLPLHKSGSRSDPDNYRPISILCSLSKIIEKRA